MGYRAHVDTVRMQVWVEVDRGLAPSVGLLNDMPGVRTHASCQGTIGEGGPEPYGPYVEVSWTSYRAKLKIEQFFDLEVKGDYWGVARPRKAKEAI